MTTITMRRQEPRFVLSVDQHGNAVPAYERHGGFVTQADINRHGSYAAARAAKDAR